MKIKRQFTLLDRETIGGLLLIIATIISLIIANSPLAHSYHDLMEKHFVMGIMDAYNLDLSIHHWVNDGLMVIFFLVAGLEMKREILVGELSSKQKAAMPLISAIGGMLVPAAIFIIFNAGEESSKGWAIPMATDIAYALGIMGLLEKRIPVQLKIFLVALAIADDVGAILVIAFFYSSEIAWGYLAVAAGLYAVMTIMNLKGVKALSWYLLFGLGFWLCFLYSGIHATIAGVLFAVVIPVMPRFSTNLFWKKVEAFKSRFNEERNKELNPLVDTGQRDLVADVRKDFKHSQSPLVRLEHRLAGFNSYFVIPVFALVNAGVKLDMALSELFTKPLGLGIIAGLIVGKALGIFSFAYLGYKLKIATLSKALTWNHILGAGFIAGIGFTMSLFITNLAFAGDQEMIKTAKISILLASLVAGIVGSILLLLTKKTKP